jgi:VWFA-related protein
MPPPVPVARCLGLAALLSAALAWHPLVSARQQPVFRSGVDLVTVDVSVVDRRGKPIEGLSADRFEVSVDGAPRRVVWAEYVPYRSVPLAATTPLDHFSSNEQVDAGRLILIAVDQSHIRRVEGLAALRAAASFVDALDRSDRVAAAPLSHAGAIQFTTDHAGAKRYLQRLTGEAAAMPVHFKIGLTEALAIADGSRTLLDQVVRRECGEPLGRIENLRRLAENEGLRDPCPVQIEQESRALAQMVRTEARITLDAMARLIARLAEIDGPKTLVLLSEGLIAEPQLIARERPARRKPRPHLLVEMHGEHLVLRVARLCERQAGGDHRITLPLHAAAAVDDQADRDRAVLVEEEVHLLGPAVLVDGERFFRQARDEPGLAVEHRDSKRRMKNDEWSKRSASRRVASSLSFLHPSPFTLHPSSFSSSERRAERSEQQRAAEREQAGEADERQLARGLRKLPSRRSSRLHLG